MEVSKASVVFLGGPRSYCLSAIMAWVLVKDLGSRSRQAERKGAAVRAGCGEWTYRSEIPFNVAMQSKSVRETPVGDVRENRRRAMRHGRRKTKTEDGGTEAGITSPLMIRLWRMQCCRGRRIREMPLSGPGKPVAVGPNLTAYELCPLGTSGTTESVSHNLFNFNTVKLFEAHRYLASRSIRLAVRREGKAVEMKVEGQEGLNRYEAATKFEKAAVTCKLADGHRHASALAHTITKLIFPLYNVGNGPHKKTLEFPPQALDVLKAASLH
ncbi:hypothetical protein C8F04DRAFT_1231770 [Mycena alexandri]|uniref:Uncharacterized protein n=1 Tax=Mycena alexandri TaxID=1745969 RepID=A0AAD6T407_9AGAR|nr:hypothetical protein C8F04DRAFT_1231770 [Mycena alexandri]